MRHISIPVGVAVAAAIILLPRPASAGEDCMSKGGCGEVRDGLPQYLSRNPLNWKCVKADFQPSFPGIPVCPVKTIEMKKSGVRMPITFGAPAAPEVVQSK